MNLIEAINGARGGQAKTIRCPAHGDKTPSLRVSRGRNGSVLLHCFGGCDSQAVLDAEGLTWAALRGMDAPTYVHPAEDTEKAAKRASWPPFEEPTEPDLEALARLRNLSAEGLRIAVDRGILKMAHHKGQRAWVVTDDSRLSGQARRMDGRPWVTENGTPKALNLPGSVGSHMVGIAALRPEHAAVLLLEGGPDLLTAFHYIWCEGMEKNSHAVALLGAGMTPMESDVVKLEGRRVRIVSHNDDKGRDASRRWADLVKEEAGQCSILNLPGLRKTDGSAVSDLNDITSIHADDFETHADILLRIVP